MRSPRRAYRRLGAPRTAWLEHERNRSRDGAPRSTGAGVAARALEEGPLKPPRQDEQRPFVVFLLRRPLTMRRAAGIISLITVAATVAAAVAVRILDHKEFHNLGDSFWWAVQTVTTVGYGDITPKQTGGQIIAAAIMITGIGFISVMTASVTAALIETVRRRRDSGAQEALAAQLGRIDERLTAIEQAVGETRRSPGP